VPMKQALRWRFVIGYLSVLLLAAPLCGRAQVRVAKEAAGKSGMDFSGLAADRSPAAETVLRVLEADLLRSGWFENLAPGRGGLRLVGAASTQGREVRLESSVYRPDGRRLFGKTYRGRADQPRRIAHEAADDIVEELIGRPGMASARLVFVGVVGNAKELFLADADGANLKQLTRDGTISVAPTWGPRGETIYYTSYLQRFPDILAIDLASGNRNRMAAYPGLNTGPAVSPDGRELALILSKDGNPDLYVMNLRDRKPVRITRTPRAAEASPSWSPDGRRLVYVSDTSGKPQLYLVDARGGTPRRLRLRGSENVAPDWGASGWIACSARLGGSYQILIFHPDTLEVRQVSSGVGDFEDPSWAPNGRHLFCSRTVNFQSRICILDTMGDEPVPFRFGEGDWISPDCSP